MSSPINNDGQTKEPLYNGFVDDIFRIERSGDKASLLSCGFIRWFFLAVVQWYIG